MLSQSPFFPSTSTPIFEPPHGEHNAMSSPQIPPWSPQSPQQGTKRKREADGDSAKDGALQRMYKSEQWSDLSIETPTRTFRVHKAVVCEINPFMKAACTRGFVETQTSRIKLPEDEVVVEAILQSFYEVPVALLKTYGVRDTPCRALLQAQATNLIKLGMARDKYDLGDDFGRKIDHAFGQTLHRVTEPRTLVEVGCTVWNDPADHLRMMRAHAMVNTVCHLQSIVEDTDTWGLLCQCPQFLRKTLEYSHSEAQDGIFFWPCAKPLE